MEEKLTLLQQNAKHQRNFKERKKQSDPDGYKVQRTEEMRRYREKRKLKEASLKPILIANIEPLKTITLHTIEDVKANNKLLDNTDTIPLFKRTNKSLKQSTINDYIKKLNVINKLITTEGLKDDTKNEIIKLLEGKDFNQSLLDVNLKYLKNITDVINKVREKYQNDNTFRVYINVLIVVLNRIPKYQNEYQRLSKIHIQLLKEYTIERNKNEVAKEDEGKLISFKEEDIKKNINELTNIRDKMLYVMSIYLLRRLEIRKLILAESESDDINNFLIVDKNNNPIKAVFNEYKTKKKDDKQIVPINEKIKSIVKEYLDTFNIKLGEYVFSQKQDKRLIISQSNFSEKIKKLFTKIYGEKITNRWIRMSYTSSKKYLFDAVKEFENDAVKLSHSVETHKQYFKNKKND
jgi:hypothetical protein